MGKLNSWQIVDAILGVARVALLYGPPGTGKSYAAHGDGGREVYSVTLTQDTPAAELRGHYVPVGGSFEWRDGPATRAWREGARLVVNEIDHAGGDLLSLLLAVADNSETARMTLPTGETVKPAAGFQVVATMNGRPEDLPEALANRFITAIECPEPHPAAIEALPERLRDAARGSCVAEDPAQRITLRAWLAFASHCRAGLPEEIAAAAVFGARAADVLQSLKIAD